MIRPASATQTTPSQLEDRESRLRKVFAVEPHGPIPSVHESALLQYHAYLSTQLCLPFEATHEPEPGAPWKTVMVEVGARTLNTRGHRV